MIIEAILKINPNAQVTVNEDDINQITWHNGTTPISKADIEAQLPVVEFDKAMADLRAKRDRLLADTDWMVLPDSPVEPAGKSKIMTYRATLRNITEGLETVEDVKAVHLPGIPVL